MVAFATVTVSAGIGLHLEIKGLLSAGARAVLLGAVGLRDDERSDPDADGLGEPRRALAELFLTSVAAVGGSFALWQLMRRTRSFMVTPPRCRAGIAR